MQFEAGEPMVGKPVDYIFLGACTNGRIEDFRAFASIVKGRHKAPGITAWLVPGSWLVSRQIEEEGLGNTLREAGFEIRQPGCSACLAMNDDKVPAQVLPIHQQPQLEGARARAHAPCWPVRSQRLPPP